MDDSPDYDITEFLLCGFFIAGAAASLVWAGASLHADDLFTAMEGAGLALMLLGGSVHPKKYIVDCMSFPLSVMEPTGRETPLTVFAAGAGLAIWLTGVVGTHWGAS